MSRRIPLIRVFIFSFFLLLVSNKPAISDPQQMTPISGPSWPLVSSRELLVSYLHLKVFAAAADDLALCAGDAYCLRHAKQIRELPCAVDACMNASKAPTSCFANTFDHYSAQDQQQASAAICAWVKSPSHETRVVVVSHIPILNETDLVRAMAYVAALKGSGDQCVSTFKDFWGAYGPQWQYKWYRELAGCRIMSHQSTYKQEEKDFYTWYGVEYGLDHCAHIIDPELHQACSVPGSSSPVPTIYDQ